VADPGGAPRLSQSRVRPLHFVMTARITGFGEGRKTMHYAFPQTILSVPSTTSLIVWSAPLSVQSASSKRQKNAPILLSALGEKIMKVTTLILALLALALATGTAMVTSIQMQPVAACGGPNC
jgi:hypothetical protein